jgi:regulator of extracellular matrix RemA (YlzA/DUF370 family)
MPRILILGRGGSIDADRVVAVASAKSAPIKRLLQAIGPERVLNLTYGYPRQAVILFDNGYLAVVSRTVDELARALHMEGEANGQPPWWE